MTSPAHHATALSLIILRRRIIAAAEMVTDAPTKIRPTRPTNSTLMRQDYWFDTASAIRSRAARKTSALKVCVTAPKKSALAYSDGDSILSQNTRESLPATSGAGAIPRPNEVSIGSRMPAKRVESVTL